MKEPVLVRCIDGHRISYCEVKSRGICHAPDITNPCRVYVEVNPEGLPAHQPAKTTLACPACVAAKIKAGAWTVFLLGRQRLQSPMRAHLAQ